MGLAWGMIALGIGSTVGALLHAREVGRGKRLDYPLAYDWLGAVGFLAFGVGTLLGNRFFAGSGRWWLLLLVPVALDKWRRTLAGRKRRHRP